MDASSGAERQQKRKVLEPENVALFVTRELPRGAAMVGGGLLDEKSIQVLGGPSKVGKSMLALNQALSIAAGIPFLLTFEVPMPRRVLYVQAEIAPRPLQRRLQRMVRSEGIGPDAQEKLFVASAKGLKVTTRDGWTRVRDAAKEVGAEVLVIDPLSRFFTGDENKAGDAQRLVDALDGFVASLNLSVVLVHHHGKPPADGKPTRHGAQQLRGSSVLFDAFDSYLSLTRLKGEHTSGYARLTFDLRNEADPEPMTIFRDPETLWWQVVENSPVTKQAGQSAPGPGVADVVQALAALGGAAERQTLLAEVQSKAGLKERASRDLIKRAENLGRIVVEQLPGKGAPQRLWTQTAWAGREAE